MLLCSTATLQCEHTPDQPFVSSLYCSIYYHIFLLLFFCDKNDWDWFTSSSCWTLHEKYLTSEYMWLKYLSFHVATANKFTLKHNLVHLLLICFDVVFFCSSTYLNISYKHLLIHNTWAHADKQIYDLDCHKQTGWQVAKTANHSCLIWCVMGCAKFKWWEEQSEFLPRLLIC